MTRVEREGNDDADLYICLELVLIKALIYVFKRTYVTRYTIEMKKIIKEIRITKS